MKKYVLLILCLLLSACEKAPEKSAFDLNAALGGVPDKGFLRATEPRVFNFPADHAAHRGFRNEWWYVTGNLRSKKSERSFGYQVTFFRIALAPEVQVHHQRATVKHHKTLANHDQGEPTQSSAWATRQIWMAHVALTDVTGQQHFHDQRFARGAAGLAGQSNQPFRVWLEDWQLLGRDDSNDGSEVGMDTTWPWAVRVNTPAFILDLSVSPHKPFVLQGDQGLSQKSSAPGNASYYYSFTRLATTGQVSLGDEIFEVQGDSWLDREWSTSVLGEDQAGWDWFSLQLNSGQELMFYQLRKTSGAIDEAHSAGKWVEVNGQATAVNTKDITLKPLRYWQAPSGKRYPVEWSLQLPEYNADWIISARIDDQLMQTGIIYWEGAVNITDASKGKLLGHGYLEMSGYEQ